MGLRSGVAMTVAQAAVAGLIRPLAWEFTEALKRKKKKSVVHGLVASASRRSFWFFFLMLNLRLHSQLN